MNPATACTDAELRIAGVAVPVAHEQLLGHATSSSCFDATISTVCILPTGADPGILKGEGGGGGGGGPVEFSSKKGGGGGGNHLLGSNLYCILKGGGGGGGGLDTLDTPPPPPPPP